MPPPWPRPTSSRRGRRTRTSTSTTSSPPCRGTDRAHRAATRLGDQPLRGLTSAHRCREGDVDRAAPSLPVHRAVPAVDAGADLARDLLHLPVDPDVHQLLLERLPGARVHVQPCLLYT